MYTIFVRHVNPRMGPRRPVHESRRLGRVRDGGRAPGGGREKTLSATGGAVGDDGVKYNVHSGEVNPSSERGRCNVFRHRLPHPTLHMSYGMSIVWCDYPEGTAVSCVPG
ncbi:hypothetical protein EVAR_77718_1 [Eumeta japonica]|uniref:Uncharacterized protein n=1 Tax=Eumeta variegata TaxID=151549 RepID=A0A4C1TAN8_EUMVA|nr:hypothetical protein EVAR_77718_1 [Eumeta japonica]